MRAPPHDKAAESAVLGAVLLRPQVLGELRDLVGEDDWYVPAHAAVWSAMIRIADRGDPIDLATLEAQLRASEDLGLVGGGDRLSRLADDVTASSNAVHHARRVRDIAGLRRFLLRTREISESTDDALERPALWCDRVADELQTLARFGSVGQYDRWSQHMHAAIAEAERRRVGGIIPTPWATFDELIDGWIPPDLIVMAARPSFGKTAFAMDCIRDCGRQQIPVLVFSLEMSKEQLIQRALSAESNVDSKRWRSGQWQLGELEQVVRSAGSIHDQPVYVVDDVEEIGEISSLARRWRNDRKVFAWDPEKPPPRGLIVLDYLQLAHASGYGAKRELEISKISRSLKKLAKELSVPILVLAQLNREVDKRKGHRPLLSDLRESGAVEQDADTVIFLHRPDKYDRSQPAGVTEVIVAKQRNGQTGMIRLDFADHLVTFLEHRRTYQGGS